MEKKCLYTEECSEKAEFFCECDFKKVYCMSHSTDHLNQEGEHKQISINSYVHSLQKLGKKSLKNLKELEQKILTEGNDLMIFINSKISQSLQRIKGTKKSILSLINIDNFGYETEYEIKTLGELAFSTENQDKLHELLNDFFDLTFSPKDYAETCDLNTLNDSIFKLKSKIRDYQAYIIEEKLLSVHFNPELSGYASEVQKSRKFIKEMAKSISQPKKRTNVKSCITTSVKNLYAHVNDVCFVAVSQSGRFVVSGSKDRSIKIWDFQVKNLKATFQGHRSWVHSIAISQDEQYIVSGSEDKSVIVWSMIDNCQVFTLTGHISSIFCVAISNDNEYIISGDAASKVRIWSFKSRTEILSYDHSTLVNSVAISKIKNYAVSGSYEGTIKVFDFIENTEKCIIQAFSQVNAVLVSDDEKFIVAGLQDCSVKIWDFNNIELLFILKGHHSAVKCISASKNFNYLMSGSMKGCVIVWNMLNKSQEIVVESKSTINSVSISEDEKYGFLACNDCKVKFLKLQSKVTEVLLSGHADLVTCVYISSNGEFAASGSNDKTVRFWSIKERGLIFSLNGHRSGIKAVSISFDLKFIGSVDENCEFILWNVHTRTEIFRVPGFDYFTQTHAVSENRLIGIEAHENFLKLSIVTKKN